MSNDYLNAIAPHVTKLDADLSPFFQKKSASAELAQVKTALDAADTTQEVALAGLPADTLAVYEAKGRVLEAIEDLNAVARNAFDGQAEIVGQFNKDVLNRSRKKRAAKEEQAPT